MARKLIFWPIYHLPRLVIKAPPASLRPGLSNPAVYDKGYEVPGKPNVILVNYRANVLHSGPWLQRDPINIALQQEKPSTNKSSSFGSWSITLLFFSRNSTKAGIKFMQALLHGPLISCKTIWVRVCSVLLPGLPLLFLSCKASFLQIFSDL